MRTLKPRRSATSYRIPFGLGERSLLSVGILISDFFFMRILLSNDDGYFSPGLAVLAETLAKVARITVVAPERDRSGASNSLTLDRPLTVRRASNGFLYVNGTPTDCVHLAVTGLLDEMPEMVVSGINHGANMGDDTIYSGTVAAAMEGYMLGIPSMAVSLVSNGEQHFATAARIVADLIERHQREPFPEPMLLNINVPDLPFERLAGIQVTRLGKRHKAEGVVKSVNPRGETVFWVGAAGAAQDAGEGTDFHAVARGAVSVTPLQADLTRFTQLEACRQWLKAYGERLGGQAASAGEAEHCRARSPVLSGLSQDPEALGPGAASPPGRFE